MRKGRLGRSGLIVTSLGLGCMTFGSQVDATLATRILDRALEAGINLFDTAEMYSSPSRAETYGRSEEILGAWARTKPRDAVIIATKMAGASDWPSSAQMPWIRGGHYVVDRHHATQAVENSLRRLGLDHIDLYQMHWPDRNTPHDEQLEAMDRLIASGKIRYFGTSNDTPWGVTRLCADAEAGGCHRPVSVQNAYNLLQRGYEQGLEETCIREGVGMLAFSPLAMGLLSGKYAGKTRPPDARLSQFSRYGDMYLQDRMIACADEYVAVARKHGVDPVVMAYAWAANRAGVAAILTSCSRIEQLDPYLASAEFTLSSNLLGDLDRVRTSHDARWNMFG